MRGASNRSVSKTFTASFMALAIAACAAGAPPPKLVAEQQPACVRWAAEARYRPYGYDHVVHIHNTCAAVADCVVRTNVNPEPIRATIAPNSKAEVVTWVGSPSREFTAQVSCTLAAAM